MKQILAILQKWDKEGVPIDANSIEGIGKEMSGRVALERIDSTLQDIKVAVGG